MRKQILKCITPRFKQLLKPSDLIAYAIGLLMLAGINEFVTKPLFYKLRGVIEEKTLEHLIVNTSNKHRVIVYKNEDEGIKDLKYLANNTNFEESWAYIPSETKWIETGINPFSSVIDETDTSPRAIVLRFTSRQDLQLLLRLIESYDNIVLYHTHPCSEKTFKEEAKDSGYSPEEVLIQKRITNVMRALPSGLEKELEYGIERYIEEDMGIMIRQSTLFYWLHPGGRITFKLASPLGITEYELSETGKNIYLKMAKLEKLEEDIKKNSKERKKISLDCNFVEVDMINEILLKHYNNERYFFRFIPYSQ